MTDRQRAESWLVGWLEWLPAEHRDGFVDALAGEFRAARLGERAAIVAYLRARYAAEAAARRVELGEHEAAL